jgi:succinyl-CoA synthetase beta subunit
MNKEDEMNDMSKFINHLLGDKSTKALTINIIGDAYTLDQTHIKVEKAVGGKSTAWRAEHITAIRERCQELGLEDEKKKYMQQTYGVDSLTMLSDTDIEEIYKWIMQYR